MSGEHSGRREPVLPAAIGPAACARLSDLMMEHVVELRAVAEALVAGGRRFHGRYLASEVLFLEALAQRLRRPGA